MADHLPSSSCREGDDVESNDVVEEDEIAPSSSSLAAAFLGELNLVMMVAFLTLSADDLSRLDDEPEKAVAAAAAEDQHARGLLSKRNRQADGVKAADRRSVSRSQPKIVDCRHGRKM